MLFERNVKFYHTSYLPYNSMEELSQIYNKAEDLDRNGLKQDSVKLYSDFINKATVLARNANHKDFKECCSALALAHNNRGYLRYLQVEFTVAVKDYTTSIGYNPDMAISYYNRGLIHYRLGRFDEAIEDTGRALLLEPNFEAARQCHEQSKIDKSEARDMH